MGKTSTEVKQRWEAENYQRYMFRLRNDTDQDLIDYIEEKKDEGMGITEIIREALEQIVYK